MDGVDLQVHYSISKDLLDDLLIQGKLLEIVHHF